MPYSEDVADRVRELVSGLDGFSERKMFGGLCFMMHGNMFAGVVKDELMLRVGPHAFEAALARPGARPMDFTGRPMSGMVYVEPAAFASREALDAWLNDALAYVSTIPPKQAKSLRPKVR